MGGIARIPAMIAIAALMKRPSETEPVAQSEQRSLPQHVRKTGGTEFLWRNPYLENLFANGSTGRISNKPI